MVTWSSSYGVVAANLCRSSNAFAPSSAEPVSDESGSLGGLHVGGQADQIPRGERGTQATGCVGAPTLGSSSASQPSPRRCDARRFSAPIGGRRNVDPHALLQAVDRLADLGLVLEQLGEVESASTSTLRFSISSRTWRRLAMSRLTRCRSTSAVMSMLWSSTDLISLDRFSSDFDGLGGGLDQVAAVRGEPDGEFLVAAGHHERPDHVVDEVTPAVRAPRSRPRWTAATGQNQ